MRAVVISTIFVRTVNCVKTGRYLSVIIESYINHVRDWPVLSFQRIFNRLLYCGVSDHCTLLQYVGVGKHCVLVLSKVCSVYVILCSYISYLYNDD